ncbi:MAG: hypothetical protein U0W24_07900 [Bacteroidales bacterium]
MKLLLVLSNSFAFEQKLNYIHENPVLAWFVDNPVNYTFSALLIIPMVKDMLRLLRPDNILISL